MCLITGGLIQFIPLSPSPPIWYIIISTFHKVLTEIPSHLFWSKWGSFLTGVKRRMLALMNKYLRRERCITFKLIKKKNFFHFRCMQTSLSGNIWFHVPSTTWIIHQQLAMQTKKKISVNFLVTDLAHCYFNANCFENRLLQSNLFTKYTSQTLRNGHR